MGTPPGLPPLSGMARLHQALDRIESALFAMQRGYEERLEELAADQEVLARTQDNHQQAAQKLSHAIGKLEVMLRAQADLASQNTEEVVGQDYKGSGSYGAG